LLTSSLEKLGNTFALNRGKLEKKLPFPYKFVNEANVDYNYVGSVPDFKFYENISENEYNLIIKSKSININKWNLKRETIKYCEQDCKTLYYSILEFSKLIYLQFRVDI
jgi:DNA polymerase type B, organellar and viral